MSDKKIRVELDEDVARNLLALIGGSPVKRDHREAAQAIMAALPPEYPEGQMAWVTDFCKKPSRTLCIRRGGVWASQVSASNGKVERWLNDHEVIKVEPLRVLADDEIAVKRITGYDHPADLWRRIAVNVREEGSNTRAALCEAYADALDAEAKP